LPIIIISIHIIIYVWIRIKVGIPTRIIGVIIIIIIVTTPSFAKIEESSKTGAHIGAIRFEFDQQIVVAILLTERSESVFVQRILDQVVVNFAFAGNHSREPIQSSVSNVVVVGGQRPTEHVVIEVQHS